VVTHLLLGKRRRRRKAPIPPLVSAFEQETGFAQTEWDRLLQEVRVARQYVYLRMDPLVRRGAVTTKWLLQALAQATPQKSEGEQREIINYSTLKEWKDRRLISYSERNLPNLHHAATLLIARIVDWRVRNWLPTEMTVVEGQAWCWRQDMPGRTVVPCSLPLPEDLPKSALLVSAWPGMGWDPPWQRMNSLGAARWAKVSRHNQRELWDITLEDLRLWDPQVVALEMLRIQEAPDMLQTLADIALIRLAFTRLSAQS
jgi:hypothetical protein